MWLIAAYDLPTGNAKERKDYRVFRKQIEQLGMIQCQESVYFRKCLEPGQAGALQKTIETLAPAVGRLLVVAIPADVMRNASCLHDCAPQKTFLEQEPMTLL